MKISVVVPMFNAVKTIDRLVKSITIQTYQGYEVILVDDGSVDGTYEYVKDKYSDNKKIFLYKIRNSGPGLARRYGYDRSSGDLLFFVDSDDEITDKYVFSRIVAAFGEDIDVLFFDRKEKNKDGEELIGGFNKRRGGVFSLDNIDGIVRPGLGAKIFKKELFSRDFFYDSKMYEDLYATYCYLDKCKNICYIDKCFYIIHHDDQHSSVTSVLTEEMLEQAMEILLTLDKNLVNDSVRKTLEYRMVYVFLLYLNKKEFRSLKLRRMVKEIVRIIHKNKVKFIPEYRSTKRDVLKNIYFKIMVYYYCRRYGCDKD